MTLARPARRTSGSIITAPGAGLTAPAPLGPLESAEGACALLARVFCAHGHGCEDWLALIASTAQQCAPEGAAVMAAIAAPPHERTLWRAEAIALGSAYPPPAAQAIRLQAPEGWPSAGRDTVTLGCGPLTAPTVVTLADVRGRGQASEAYLMWRRRLGLHDMARAIAPVDDPRGQRVLVIQADGVRPEWSPSMELRSSLRALAANLVVAYSTRFLAARLAQQRILDRLSDRQRELLPLLVEGISEPAIARRLGRSIHTVHDHTKRIYRRLRVGSRLELRDLWLGRAGA